MFPIQTSVVRRHPPVVTWYLIGLNVAFFLMELAMPPAAREQVIHVLGIVPQWFTDPEAARAAGLPGPPWWGLLTSTFLHGGFLHVFGNMWTLWLFGQYVEDRMGPLRFLLFYLLCGIGSGIVHVSVMSGSTVPAIGASGAIAGVMAAYYLMFPLSRIVVMVPVLFFPFFFEMPAWYFLGFWFLIQLFSGTFSLAAMPDSGGIAFWAHVGGFLVGLALTRPFLHAPRHPRALQGDEGVRFSAWQR